MFDLIRFAGAGRQVTHRDRHARRVGEVLQFTFPERSRQPSLPPASAVTSSDVVWG
jgi:hypothetical protein